MQEGFETISVTALQLMVEEQAVQLPSWLSPLNVIPECFVCKDNSANCT